MAIVLRLVKGVPLTFTELDGNFTDLDGKTVTLDSRVDALESAFLTLDSDLDQAILDITDLQGRMTDVETDLETLEDRVDAIDIEIGDLQSDSVTLGTVQTLTAPKRSSILVDNDGNFDFALSANYSCTPTGGITLQFTVGSGNITGQSGFIKLYNPSGFTIAAASGFDYDSDFLALISAAGSYLLTYYAESNSQVNIVASAALT